MPVNPPALFGIPIDFMLFAAPEARSVGLWLRHGWHVAVGYLIGFAVLLAVVGWHPEPLRRDQLTQPAAAVAAPAATAASRWTILRCSATSTDAALP